MIYLLDTNTCIGYISRRSLSIFHRLTSISRQDVVLCDIVKLELYYGAFRSSRQQRNLVVLSEFFSEFVSLPFDGRAAEIGGKIRAQLAALGTPIGSNDLLIAALAKRLRRRFTLANNLTLVTHNTREFSRVVGLQIEDWETE